MLTRFRIIWIKTYVWEEFPQAVGDYLSLPVEESSYNALDEDERQLDVGRT